MSVPDATQQFELAPISRRFGADVIDGVVFLLAFGGIMVAVTKLFIRSAKRESAQNLLQQTNSRADQFRRASWIWSFCGPGLTRNWRSPGKRAMHIRRVDAPSGGPITLRSALVASCVATTWKLLGAAVFRPLDRQRDQSAQTLRAQMQLIQEQYDDDSREQQERMEAAARTHGVSCLKPLVCRLPLIVGPLLPALWSERNQTLTEFLAGTVTVIERRPSQSTYVSRS